MLALRGLVGGLISIPLRQLPPAPGIALRWRWEPAVKRPTVYLLPTLLRANGGPPWER